MPWIRTLEWPAASGHVLKLQPLRSRAEFRVSGFGDLGRERKRERERERKRERERERERERFFYREV